ncbi:MAG: outer membrane lipid asymmetry maintenance protein MlaD [Gammaproteobacteria bacterium]
MIKARFIEITVGIFIAGGIGALFMLAMKVSNLSAISENDGYTVIAQFENIGGLKEQSPVSAGGVKIGRVTSIDYNQDTYVAVVSMGIAGKYKKLPIDTSASIFTSGLLGEQYISLEPGGEEEYLGDGDLIELTQSALVMEQVVGQFLFSKAAEGSAVGE